MDSGLVVVSGSRCRLSFLFLPPFGSFVKTWPARHIKEDSGLEAAPEPIAFLGYHCSCSARSAGAFADSIRQVEIWMLRPCKVR